MSVIKFLRDWTDLFNWSTDANPTTQQDYQEAVKNWIETERNLVDSHLWQPETAYALNDVVKTPSLPSQYCLSCVTAGTSGATEPDYTNVDVESLVTDGTAIWKVRAAVANGVPTGCVQAFAGSITPIGWLLCDGSAVSRTDYADLFSVIGDTYGAGDGSTTFNLPDLVDKFIEGSATSGTAKSAGLPNISGTIDVRGGNSAGGAGSGSGAFNSGTASSLRNYSVSLASDSTNTTRISFAASDSNSIYGSSATVQPPALTMRYIIKY